MLPDIIEMGKRERAKSTQKTDDKATDHEEDAGWRQHKLKKIVDSMQNIDEETKQEILEHSADLAHDLITQSQKARQARTLDMLPDNIELGKRARARSAQKTDDKATDHEEDAG